MPSSTPRIALALIGLLLTATRPDTLSAQGTATASIDVLAAVISPISVAVTHPLDFGRMFAGAVKTVAANAAMAGRVEVSGQNGSAVSVTLTMPALLNGAGATAAPVSSWNYMVSSAATLAGATAVAFSGGTPVVVAATLGGGTGVVRLYLGLGGTVNVVGAAVGTFTGTGQITAAYTDL